MKNLLLFLFMHLCCSTYAQYYTPGNFFLNGPINRSSVICYDIESIDNELVEGFPYSVQYMYKTDLNLHYLEFNKEGQLIRSKLFYPRGFYGQFSWLEPIFNLEISDFGDNINYLSQMNRYKYNILSDANIEIQIIGDSGTVVNLLLDRDLKLREDEYYTYTDSQIESKSVITKRRKGSMYGYRRIEITSEVGMEIKKEFINNNFLISKSTMAKNENITENIFVSQSRIELSRLEYSDNLVAKKSYVDLSWRNKYLKWPEIDFNEDLTYIGFIEMLERESNQFSESYEYDGSGKILSQKKYKYDYVTPILISETEYFYNEDGLLEEEMVSNVKDGVSETLYRTYAYDAHNNWISKVVGKIVMIKGQEVKIPQKRYVKTLTYWE